MFCPNCGYDIPQHHRFCGNCGLDLAAYYAAQQTPPKKGVNLMGIVAALAAVVVIGVTAGLTLRGCGNDRDDRNDRPGNREEQVAATQTSTEEPEAMVTVYLPTRMEKTIYDGSNSLWVEEYTYDEYGNMITLTQYKPDGTEHYTITMGYDEVGNMVHRRSQGVGRASVYAYAYDSLGRQICVNDNGKKAEVRYDDQGRMIYYKEYEAISRREITYAEDGRTARDSQFRDDGSLVEYTDVYYDDRGNIVSTWRYTAEGDLLYRTDFVFDERNLQTQLLCYAFCSADHVGTYYTYTYDDYGNRIREEYSGDYYSNDHVCVYTVEPVEVLESAARRLGQ